MNFRQSVGEARDISFVALTFCVGVLIALSLAFIFPLETVNDITGSDDDHSIEEAIESVIQHNTGIDIDLTPRSQETGHGG